MYKTLFTKAIKIACLFLLIFLAIPAFLLFIWILINSHDIPDFHSQFDQPFASVPEDQNAYLQLQLDRISANTDELEPLLDHTLWELVNKTPAFHQDIVYLAEYVEAVLEDEISSVRTAVALRQLSTPYNPDDPTALPEWQPIAHIFRAHLIGAILDEKAGDYDQAIQGYGESLQLYELIKADENLNLIGYMIALSWQHDIATQINRLSKSRTISNNQLRRLLAILIDLKPATKQEAVRILSGEYRSFPYYLDHKNIDYDWLSFETDQPETDIYYFYKERILTASLRFLFKLFPDFYLKKNLSLKHGSRGLTDVLNAYATNCTMMTEEERHYTNIDSPYSAEFINFIKPNSLGLQKNDDQRNIYAPYFSRRCMAYTQLEALKAKIAIKLYQREHNTLPEKLDQLVPTYLPNLPIDYFSNKPLKYSRENSWLYSVGANRIDSGGSETSLYHYKCLEDQCADNPTFVLD